MNNTFVAAPLIVATFASGVVIESTRVAEARQQVAGAALGHAFGLACLALSRGRARAQCTLAQSNVTAC